MFIYFCRFGKEAKIVHYLGAIKPWHHFFDTETSQVHVKQAGGDVEGVRHFIQLWWDTYTCKDSPTEEQVLLF